MQSDRRSDRQETLSTPFQIHGVLVRILNKGVLLLGESGVGKSECALDLVRHGHQLVADDVIEIFERDGVLFGKAPSLTSNLIEIRGLGIIDLRDTFGPKAVCEETEIGLSVELVPWSSDDGDRLGQDQDEHDLAGYRIPKFRLTVGKSRNIATLVETAARLSQQSNSGRRATDVLLEAHDALLDPMQ